MVKYVVVYQDKDDRRICKIVGPFSSYELAALYADNMRESDKKSEAEFTYYVIRELDPTQIMRMT